MPYNVEKHDSCPASKPWGVVNQANGDVMGCHPTKTMARRQQAALYANEPGIRGDGPMFTGYERFAPLEDITIRSGGSGRTVEAYAAVFDTPQEITDREGHYIETMARTSFDRTLEQRAGKFQVLFNHGMTVHQTPSEQFSMPLGKLVTIRADQRGLYTETEYSNTPLADNVLELIRDGVVRGMSFSGRPITTKRGGRDQATGLPIKIRTEFALRELGPTPFPYYQDAQIVQVRTEFDDLDIDELVEHLLSRDENERAALLAALHPTADPGTGTDSADPGDVITLTRGQRKAQVLRRLAAEKGILT